MIRKSAATCSGGGVGRLLLVDRLHLTALCSLSLSLTHSVVVLRSSVLHLANLACSGGVAVKAITARNYKVAALGRLEW